MIYMTSSGNIAEFTESLRPSVHREAFTKSCEELFNPSVLFFFMIPMQSLKWKRMQLVLVAIYMSAMVKVRRQEK